VGSRQMSTWSKVMASAKHVTKHKSFAAKFSVEEDPEEVGSGQTTSISRAENTAYEAASATFNEYADLLKSLNGRIAEMKKTTQDAFGKAGAVGQSLVDLAEEGSGGELALKATALRTAVARTQAALMRGTIPEIDSVLQPEIGDQLGSLKEIKTRMAHRLESVADANHYKSKYQSLAEKEKQMNSAVSSSSAKDHEKKSAEMRDRVGRNLSKCDAARCALAAETKLLLDSFESMETRRKQLATERCEWLRSLLKIFFADAANSYLAGGSHELLEVRQKKESSVASTGKYVGSVGSSLGVSLSHAVKHKGGFGTVFAQKEAGKAGGDGSGGGNGSGSGSSSSGGGGADEYAAAVARHKRQAKNLNSLHLDLRAYLDALSKALTAVALVAEDFRLIGAVGSSTHRRPTPTWADAADAGSGAESPPVGVVSEAEVSGRLFRLTWEEGSRAISTLVVEAMLNSSEAEGGGGEEGGVGGGLSAIATQLEACQQVEASLLTRKQAALDVAYYEAKTKQIAEKAEKAKSKAPGKGVEADQTFLEKQQRNQQKYEQACAALEQSSNGVLGVLTSLEKEKAVLVAAIVDTYSSREQRAFSECSRQLGLSGSNREGGDGSLVDVRQPMPPLPSSEKKQPVRRVSLGGSGPMRGLSLGRLSLGSERRQSKSNDLPMAAAAATAAHEKTIQEDGEAGEEEEREPIVSSSSNSSKSASNPFAKPQTLAPVPSTDSDEPPPPAPPPAPVATGDVAAPSSSMMNPTSPSHFNEGDSSCMATPPPPPPAEEEDSATPPPTRNDEEASLRTAATLGNALDAESTPEASTTATVNEVEGCGGEGKLGARVLVKALFEFGGVEEGDLPFVEGDTFEVHV